MKMIIATAALAAVPLVLADASVTYLATFDGKDQATTWKWHETNDPVMGGLSTGTFTSENGKGIFNGTCAIVPSLKAPGFANAGTEKSLFKKFPDGSKFIDGGSLQLRARTNTPDYQGFRVAFGAKDIPRTSKYGGQSFKAGFHMIGTDYQVVDVPLTEFSYDWSPYTGRCETKDPTGQQHHCCSKDDNYKYCPTAAYLASITELDIWAEGAEGDYHLEIDWIGLGKTDTPTLMMAKNKTVCKHSEFCCPDANACLTPTNNSCAADPTICPEQEVCCPLTKLCVDVGPTCVDPCHDGGYCCPDALACLTPTNPGVLCKPGGCGNKGDICCPLTKECVSVGKKCTPP